MIRTLIFAITLLTLSIGGVLAFQGPLLKLTVEAFAPKRPALLIHASGDDPESATEFLQRFQAGSDQQKLIDWLHSEKFEVHLSSATGVATRTLVNSRCGEDLKVLWAFDTDNTLRSVSAYARPSLCY